MGPEGGALGAVTPPEFCGRANCGCKTTPDPPVLTEALVPATATAPASLLVAFSVLLVNHLLCLGPEVGAAVVDAVAAVATVAAATAVGTSG